jgi:flagellar biosynthesis protein
MAAFDTSSKSRSTSADSPPSAPERPVAVALRDTTASGRPRIVASGYDAVAERILEIAFASGVKVREDADLASTLAALEIGREIPLEAFAVVAEILSYVYRANEAARHGVGPMAPPPRAGETTFENVP